MDRMRTYINSNYFHFFSISRPGLQWGDLFLELDFLRGHEKLEDLKPYFFLKTHKYNLLVLLLLSFWSYFSFHNWIADSEFWPITLSGHFDQWRQHPALIYKSVFHLSLGWIYIFDLSSVEHIQFAKGFYTFLGGLYFYFFYFLSKRHLSEPLSVLALFVVLSSSLGFSQIGVIRSDFLASFFVLIYFFIQKPHKTFKHQCLIFLAFSILMLLATPKALFWVAALWVLLILTFNKADRLLFLKLSVSLLIVSLGVITFIDQFYLNSQIFNSFFLAWQHNSELRNSNIKMNDFEFLKPYLKNDWALLVLISFMLIQSFMSKNISIGMKFFIFIISLALITHEPKLPFFVGSYLFILFLVLMPSLQSLGNRQITILFVIVSIVNLSRIDLRQYHFPNRIQLSTIKRVSHFIDSKSYSVIDGLGLFPRVKKLDLTYVGPFDPVANEIFFNKIQKTKPDFLVYTGRFLNLEPEISKLLANYYKNVGNGYWLRKDIDEKIKFEHVLSGFHFNYRPDLFLTR